MKNIPFEDIPVHDSSDQETQLQRLQQVLRQELTDLQRQTLMQYYFHNQSISQIAQDRGVHKSTVSRTLKRAESRLRQFLQY